MNCLGFMEQKVFSIWTILELSLCTFTGWNLDVGFLYSFCLAFNGSFDLKSSPFSPSLNLFSAFTTSFGNLTSVVIPFFSPHNFFSLLFFFLIFVKCSGRHCYYFSISSSQFFHMHQNHLEGLLKINRWIPSLEFRFSSFGGRAKKGQVTDATWYGDHNRRSLFILATP